ncbi:hypothetical protein EVAR_76601_1 [Eumeta japonica]|uniref:Uncharacterized protein n=1 Tax=Eumeta variegata TaxID=151549 RepID=A0A4C1T849_EUMVA|nr:hypothetical protein EVAR_76601_1 [Eumeta japonica]
MHSDREHVDLGRCRRVNHAGVGSAGLRQTCVEGLIPWSLDLNATYSGSRCIFWGAASGGAGARVGARRRVFAVAGAAYWMPETSAGNKKKTKPPAERPLSPCAVISNIAPTIMSVRRRRCDSATHAPPPAPVFGLCKTGLSYIMHASQYSVNADQ